MRFLEDTDLLKIEDILPFFPDFVVIDDFKDEIANALEGYAAQIDGLKSEMDDATKNADSIKEYIAGLRNRFITIDAGEKCTVCSYPLLTRQFYVFPCQHTFHADCLIGLVSLLTLRLFFQRVGSNVSSCILQTKEYLPAHALRRILALQNELIKGNPSSIDRSAINTLATPGTGTVPSRQQQHQPHHSRSVSNSHPSPHHPLPPTAQRTLLSSNFTAPLQNGTRAANSLGRNILSAGDRLRDLIVPDALASVVTAPVGWIPGIGLGAGVVGGGGAKRGTVMEKELGKRAERMRKELDEILARECPLCESVVVGLDKPFVKEGEVDSSWDL